MSVFGLVDLLRPPILKSEFRARILKEARFCVASIFCILPNQHILDTNRDDCDLQNVQFFSIDNQTESAFAAFSDAARVCSVHRFPRGTRTENPIQDEGSRHLIIIVTIGSL